MWKKHYKCQPTENEILIEIGELLMSVQASVDAAVAALNALVADKQANPPVDTAALDVAVAAADAALAPVAPQVV